MTSLEVLEDDHEDEEAYQRVYEQAIRWLGQRPYGTEELTRRLENKVPDEDHVHIARVVDRCVSLGYLDDYEFALGRIRNRMISRGYGPAWVQMDLRSRGVDDTVVRSALREVLAEVNLVELASDVLKRRFSSAGSRFVLPSEREDAEKKPRMDRKEKKRRYDFLMRRGFDSDIVWTAMERSFGRDDDDVY
ncbi:MAG: RecX family transcriptional regulator [Magnetococcales bacterium]|nr:RecX family transcriptional regulator [Magnetococcales bacterium]